MRPFALQQIDHLVFRVRDLNVASHFYCAALGCEIVKRRDDLGLLHLQAGRSMIDLISIDGPLGSKGGAAAATARNVDHLCLRVEPFDEAAIVQHLAQFNCPPIGPAESNFGAEGEGLSLYLFDPDGNLLELKGPSEPSPLAS